MAKQQQVSALLTLFAVGLFASDLHAQPNQPPANQNVPSVEVTESAGAPGPEGIEVATVIETQQSEADQPKEKKGLTVPEGHLSADGFAEDGDHNKLFMMPADGFSADGRPMKGGKPLAAN